MICKKCEQRINTGTKCFQCGYDSQKDELQVEQYDAAAVEAKKKEIFIKVGIGIGWAAVIAVLGFFGLLIMRPDLFTGGGAMLGGAGAWFNSRVVFLEDEDE